MPKKKHRPRKQVRRHPPQPARTRRADAPAMGSDVISFAPSQGVDADELHEAWQHEGWEEGERHDDEWHDDELDGVLPAFLGERPDNEALWAHFAGVDVSGYFADSTLMRRADLVLHHIGEGHPFTEEEGLGREATMALLEQFGYETQDIETTWDAAPVNALLTGLAEGGFLKVSDGQVRPAAVVLPWAWPDAPPLERTGAGRLLHATALNAFLEESEEGSPAMAGQFTVMAFMAMCGPDGLRLPESAADTGEYEALQRDVRADLVALADLGIVHRDGDVFTASPALLPVVAAVIETVFEELPL